MDKFMDEFTGRFAAALEWTLRWENYPALCRESFKVISSAFWEIFLAPFVIFFSSLSYSTITAIIETLLYIFPCKFRHEQGDLIILEFEEQYHEVRGKSIYRVIWVLLRCAGDILISVPFVWKKQLNHNAKKVLLSEKELLFQKSMGP